MTKPPRLLAHFKLRESATGQYAMRMPLPAGDYHAEIEKVGDDLEIRMYEKQVNEVQT